ncbi:Hsp70 family protein [Streptomyces venezuelae]|uniref:Hsp70 family protein n=1 Tax=Streptomyces venezuelae TaxID=54571 RepID=UPI00364B65C1
MDQTHGTAERAHGAGRGTAAQQPVLAVDFGTSASSAALLTEAGTRLLKERATGSWAWPSAVCLRDDTLLIGTPAEHRKKVRPELYRSEFKRDIGQDAPIPLGERSYAPGDLVARVLAAFRDEAERLIGGPVDRAVLTVPAAYGPADPRRQVMLEAGRAAGFGAVELLAEPAAAAYAPVAGKPVGPGQTLLVYDFGGGTFDAALVRLREGGSHEVLGHNALEDCGGSDIDALLLAEIRTRGGEAMAAALRPGAETAGARTAARRNALELGDFARRLKHQLSADSYVEDIFGSTDVVVELDRKRFVKIVEPLLARTVDCCRSLLTAAELTVEQVDAVLLVGGTTRMPAVADLVHQALGRPLRSVEDPELAVAQGAARWASYARERHLVPADHPRGERPLSWQFAGGTVELVQWLQAPGAVYAAGEALALARPSDGSLWELRAEGRPGRIVAQHAAVGQTVVSGDWLVTVGAPDAPAAPVASAAVKPGGTTAWLTDGWLLRTVRHAKDSEVVPPALSADGKWLATGASDGTACVLDMATGRTLTTVRHPEPVLTVAVGDGGTLLASGARAPDARLSRHSESVLVSTHGDWVRAVAVTEDGRWFASASDDAVVHVWDVRAHRRVASLRHESWVLALALSADGRVLATGDRDGTCRVWSLPDATETWSIPYGVAINGVSLSADGERLAIGVQSGRVHVWDLPRSDCLLTLDHAAAVNSVSLSSDGSLLAVAPALWSAQVRAVDTDRLLCEIAHPEALTGASLSGDGRRLATSCQDGTARVWALTQEDS